MDESRTSQHCSDGNRLDTWHPTQRPWGIKTITDTDTFIQHWIHLYYRYLFCGRSEKEALEFLKSHGATHLMLTEEGVVRYAHINSSLGSRSEQEKPFEIIYLQEVIREQEHLVLVSERETPFFKNIQVDMHTETNRPFSAIVIRQNGTATNLPYVAYENKNAQPPTIRTAQKQGASFFILTNSKSFKNVITFRPLHGITSRYAYSCEVSPAMPFFLSTQIAKRGQQLSKSGRYIIPPDIQPNPKYLKTGVPEIDAQLQMTEST